MQFITGKKDSMVSWLVCLTGSFFFFYDFIQLNMCNVLSEVLMRDFNIGATGLGNLSSCFMYGNMLFVFPAGIIMDRYTTRKIVISMLMLSIISALGFATVKSYSLACAFRLLGGAAHAFCFLGCISLVRGWFSSKKQAFVIGVIIMIAMLGGLVAQRPLAALSAYMGWRNALLVNVALGVGIWVLAYLVVTDHAKDMVIKDDSTQAKESFFEGLRKAMSNAQAWFCGLYTGLLNLPIMVLGASFGSAFLIAVHGLNKMSASNVSMMLYLGTALGCPLAGWLSDRWGKRKLPMLLGACISLCIFVLILYRPGLPVSLLSILFFALGLFTSAQIISYAVIGESTPLKIASTSTGIAATLIMGLAGFSQPLVGKLLDIYWEGELLQGVRIYSAHGFTVALSVLVGAFVLALVALYFVKETHGKPLKKVYN